MKKNFAGSNKRRILLFDFFRFPVSQFEIYIAPNHTWPRIRILSNWPNLHISLSLSLEWEYILPSIHLSFHPSLPPSIYYIHTYIHIIDTYSTSTHPYYTYIDTFTHTSIHPFMHTYIHPSVHPRYSLIAVYPTKAFISHDGETSLLRYSNGLFSRGSDTSKNIVRLLIMRSLEDLEGCNSLW